MRKHPIAASLHAFAALLIVAARLETAQAGPFDFFPLDNGVGRGSWTPQQQAACIQEVGFDGIGYNYTDPADLADWLKELTPRRLKLYSLYFPLSLEKEDPYPVGMRQAITMLKGAGTALWITIPMPEATGEYDALAGQRIDAMADLAAASGLRVVIYPHKGCYAATAEDALRIVKHVKRDNVGVTVNLCHELAAGNGARLKEIIKAAAPRLGLVTICGATDVPSTGFDKYIQTLDQGDYDVYGMLKTLKDVGYQGPVGLQCYMIKGDVRDNLGRSMGVWKRYMARLEKGGSAHRRDENGKTGFRFEDRSILSILSVLDRSRLRCSPHCLPAIARAARS